MSILHFLVLTTVTRFGFLLTSITPFVRLWLPVAAHRRQIYSGQKRPIPSLKRWPAGPSMRPAFGLPQRSFGGMASSISPANGNSSTLPRNCLPVPSISMSTHLMPKSTRVLMFRSTFLSLHAYATRSASSRQHSSIQGVTVSRGSQRR